MEEPKRVAPAAGRAREKPGGLDAERNELGGDARCRRGPEHRRAGGRDGGRAPERDAHLQALSRNEAAAVADLGDRRELSAREGDDDRRPAGRGRDARNPQGLAQNAWTTSKGPCLAKGARELPAAAEDAEARQGGGERPGRGRRPARRGAATRRALLLPEREDDDVAAAPRGARSARGAPGSPAPGRSGRRRRGRRGRSSRWQGAQAPKTGSDAGPGPERAAASRTSASRHWASSRRRRASASSPSAFAATASSWSRSRTCR